MVRLRSAVIFATLAATLAIPAPNAATANTSSRVFSAEDISKEDLPFKPSANQMADVTATLEKAKESGKLGLVIMGANWCHDSRALVSKFADPVLAQILAEKYETVLIDVGELKNGKDIIERFGMPVIYGTPTVLIVDPSSEQQLNGHNMHQWRDAYSISQEDTTAYFENMASAETRGTPASDPAGAELHALLEAVNNFEKKQSERVYRAFNLIGPMITMPHADRPENFTDLWNELRDFRYQITADLEHLRNDARARIAAGEGGLTLDFPIYEPFSWEK